MLLLEIYLVALRDTRGHNKDINQISYFTIEK